MNTIQVKMKFMHPVWEENELAYATDHSAGLDLRACIDDEFVEIGPGEKYPFPAGVAIEVLEPSIAGYIFSRSGLGTKDGLTVSQGVGVIDPDYRGEIKVSLLNTSDKVRRIKRGQRIAQLVFMPIFQADILKVEELGDTDRGAGGFGSTGKH
ncbi:dUTP diphosphatase [Pseudodesulfovibrio portus]|uniref:dUTP diphosphatase n=1 Tax=Pseudodesulfovibrio portus TaxID=231439 RepID=A0ABM8AMU6_9BACT|nr:dUTP diphosphatase [Pseudodesulfovibrio portus]BDQ32713.1 deoxyuridine 5'-triphosphate nucleotidohydrolase [Pseudodesulfovibrio portus]